MIDSLPTLLGGRYRVIRLLGRGGVGQVHEVEHARTGEHFALKVLSGHALIGEGALERFRREARVTSQIKSEHVVRVIDADVAPELDGAPYLVMELLNGQTLGQICLGLPQPSDRVIGWLRQLASVIDAAHGAGIVHRDLKPENLFLARREDGSTILKVLDFGLAKAPLDDVGISSGSGEILGTPLFMAPEQADLGKARVTPRADLFALGLIAHKLLTGRHYWCSQQLVQLVREICMLPMDPPSKRGSTLGSGFDVWFARACHRDPRERFESAVAQVDALERALGVEAQGRISSASAGVVVRASRPRGLVMPFLLLACAIGGVSVVASVMRRTPSAMAAHRLSVETSVAGAGPPALASEPSASAASPLALPEAPTQTYTAVLPPSTAGLATRTATALAKRGVPGLAQTARPARDPWADQK
jgi:eukaryotic-like serine/threonine-protein kinase